VLKATDKNKGANNFWYGKEVSEERRQQQREFRLGKNHPEEVKVKIILVRGKTDEVKIGIRRFQKQRVAELVVIENNYLVRV